MRIVHLAAVVAGILTGAANLSDPARATPLAGALPAAATTAASPLVSDVRYYYGYPRPVYYRPYYRRRAAFYRRPVYYRPQPTVRASSSTGGRSTIARTTAGPCSIGRALCSDRPIWYRPRPIFYRPWFYRRAYWW